MKNSNLKHGDGWGNKSGWGNKVADGGMNVDGPVEKAAK
jgi:hypothetical protein